MLDQAKVLEASVALDCSQGDGCGPEFDGGEINDGKVNLTSIIEAWLCRIGIGIGKGFGFGDDGFFIAGVIDEDAIAPLDLAQGDACRGIGNAGPCAAFVAHEMGKRILRGFGLEEEGRHAQRLSGERGVCPVL